MRGSWSWARCISWLVQYHIFDVAVNPMYVRAGGFLSIPWCDSCNFVSVSAWRLRGMTMRSLFRTSPSSTDSSSRCDQNVLNGVGIQASLWWLLWWGSAGLNQLSSRGVVSAVSGLRTEQMWSYRPAQSSSHLRKVGVTRGQPKRVFLPGRYLSCISNCWMRCSLCGAAASFSDGSSQVVCGQFPQWTLSRTHTCVNVRNQTQLRVFVVQCSRYVFCINSVTWTQNLFLASLQQDCSCAMSRSINTDDSVYAGYKVCMRLPLCKRVLSLLQRRTRARFSTQIQRPFSRGLSMLLFVPRDLGWRVTCRNP